MCPSGFKEEHCEEGRNSFNTSVVVVVFYYYRMFQIYNKLRGNKCQPSDDTRNMSILFFFCADINECVTEEHNCDANYAYCNKTKGSFACLLFSTL